ncbi:hypothetical protein Tco_0160962 [Tanacetum coccineum]
MTTLEFTTEISHIKALHKISDAGFNKILALLQKACSPSKGYNGDFINNEDDVVAHVLDDDDVEVSDDDEVNPSTNVEEMACVAPGSHGGDAGGSPPRRPNRHVPAQCQSSMLRLETGNASYRRLDMLVMFKLFVYLNAYVYM